MSILRVPFGLRAPLTAATRPEWLNEFVEHLGEFALKDMTFTGGTGTVEWTGSGDVSEFVACVIIEDAASAGLSQKTDGSPATPEEAAAVVVARALLDKGLTQETSWIHHDRITRVGEQ